MGESLPTTRAGSGRFEYWKKQITRWRETRPATSLDQGDSPGVSPGLPAYLPEPSPHRALQRDRVLEPEHTCSSGPWVASPEPRFPSVKLRESSTLPPGRGR